MPTALELQHMRFPTYTEQGGIVQPEPASTEQGGRTLTVQPTQEP